MNYLDFARLFGIISLILSLGVLFNLEDARTMAKRLGHSPAGYVLAGVLPLIFGLWTVMSVNNWSMGWPLVVTLIGWAMVLFSLFRLWFPDPWARYVQRNIDIAPILFSLFGLMFGLLLCYIGFIAQIN